MSRYQIFCKNGLCSYVDYAEDEWLANELRDEHHANTDHRNIEVQRLKD